MPNRINLSLSFFYKCVPTFSVVFLILSTSSLQVHGYPLQPSLYLIPVYYWLIFRPEWLPAVSLVGIGLFYDALMGREVGLSSIILLLSALVLPYARVLISYHVFWAVFCMYSLCSLCIYGLYDAVGFPLVISWIYGIFLYPLITWGMSYLHLRLDSNA